MEIVGWVEERNPTSPKIDCADVGFRIRSTQPTDLTTVDRIIPTLWEFDRTVNGG